MQPATLLSIGAEVTRNMSASKRASLVYSLVFFSLLTASAYATPTVTVISPKSGATAGSPIFYSAYATSPACTKGIAAMRIYTADHVGVYTVSGAHIETFIKLNPGTYNTVVQAWDNCGGVGKTTVTLTVTSTAGVTVFLPSTSSVAWPVHIAASAQNSACAAGISAIRIYIADHVSPYTINANQLNAYINLVPGTYKLTVQAWDKCGHVFKSQFNQPVTSTPDAYLYAVNVNTTAPDIYQFQIASDGTLKNPNGNGSLPEYSAGSGTDSLAVDPGGWFVYASSIDGIYGYQINPTNGNLTPMQGSPFPLQNYGNGVPPSISVDPSGNFLFARYGGIEDGIFSPYRIDRSSGALTTTVYAVGTAWVSRAFDSSGQYVYVIDMDNFGQLVGYRINPNNGAMTTFPGNPYYSLDVYSAVMASTGSYLYVGGPAFDSGGAIDAYTINYSIGVLTPITGSPFIVPDAQVWGVLADPQTRFMWAYEQGPTRGIRAFSIAPGTGQLTASSWFTQLDPFYIVSGTGWAEDHSGKYVFTAFGVGNPNNGESPGVASWPISANGDLQTQTEYATTNPIGSIAVARQNPN
jgi:6-phosphogluconolactonase (cycloisomerase 2 family)